MRTGHSRPERVMVLGDILVDMVSRPGGSVSLGVDTFTVIHTSQGGSAANVAARLGGLGVRTAFVGKVGDDPFGEFLESRMKGSGVEMFLSRDPSLSTGKVFVLVDGDGERTMITDRGASENLCPDDLPGDVFNPETHLHLTGYVFSEGSRRRCAVKALDLARDAGMSVSVDPSSAPLLEDIGTERFLGWTSGADLCFPNLPEGRLLTGRERPRDVVETLLDHYPAVALKLGADGALYGDRDGASVALPAVREKARDTTGAGDALCAGFLSGYVAGATPRESLERGITLAGEVVGAYGAGPGRV